MRRSPPTTSRVTTTTPAPSARTAPSRLCRQRGQRLVARPPKGRRRSSTGTPTRRSGLPTTRSRAASTTGSRRS
eukprot:7310792-Alexandrium_andersonii.AAC.1